MKSVLVILTQKDQSHRNVNESIAALMLFASFNISIAVLFKDAALSLLCSSHNFNHNLKYFLKPGCKMVDSFEFYDIENLYILNQDKNHPLVQTSLHELQAIDLDVTFIQRFDHVITW